MKKTYEIQLVYSAGDPAKGQILSLLLRRMGLRQEDIIEEQGRRNGNVKFYPKNKKAAERMVRALKGLGLEKVRVKSAVLEDREWKDKWKESLRPFRFTRNIRIVPSWLAGGKGRDPAKTIFLDTGMAFGSGLHPTTRFIAEFIEMKINHVADIFDIGTGSGILALTACKLGLKDIWCIDNDSTAVKVARDNLKANGCRVKHIESEDIKNTGVKRKFDMVAANLTTKVLLDSRRKIVSRVRNGKYLAVSGVSKDNYREFRRKFDGDDLRCLRIRKNRDWCAVLYRKMPA